MQASAIRFCPLLSSCVNVLLDLFKSAATDGSCVARGSLWRARMATVGTAKSNGELEASLSRAVVRPGVRDGWGEKERWAGERGRGGRRREKLEE